MHAPTERIRADSIVTGARQLRAALLLPSWYQPGTRLPVLLSPYGGPAMQRVVRARSAAFCEDQWFAEQGFAVLVTELAKVRTDELCTRKVGAA